MLKLFLCPNDYSVWGTLTGRQYRTSTQPSQMEKQTKHKHTKMKLNRGAGVCPKLRGELLKKTQWFLLEKTFTQCVKTPRKCIAACALWFHVGGVQEFVNINMSCRTKTMDAHKGWTMMNHSSPQITSQQFSQLGTNSPTKHTNI